MVFFHDPAKALEPVCNISWFYGVVECKAPERDETDVNQSGKLTNLRCRDRPRLGCLMHMRIPRSLGFFYSTLERCTHWSKGYMQKRRRLVSLDAVSILVYMVLKLFSKNDHQINHLIYFEICIEFSNHCTSSLILLV